MQARTLTLIGFAALAAFAAGGRSNVTGTVKDSAGGVIQNAKVTLTAGPDAGRITLSGTNGEFRFDGLASGEYSIEARADNFEPAGAKATIVSGCPNELTIVLQPKRKSEEITISAERAEVGVDPGANSNAGRLEENTLREIPTPGQNIMSVLGNFLSPAAQGAIGPSVVIDGVESNGLNLPAWGIKRIRINKNPYSVQHRRPGNSRIEVATRHGDPEDYHGGIAMYFRNSAFDARNAFAASKPELSRRTVESRVTGPIPGQNAAFLISVEQLTGKEPSLVTARTLKGSLVENVPASQDRTMLMARVDARRGELHTMNFRYTQVGGTESGHGVGGFKLAEQAVRGVERERGFLLSDRRITLSNVINEMRVGFDRGSEQNGATATAPVIKVNGAFTGGPSSTFRSDSEGTLKFQNTTTMYRGPHTIHFGGQLRPRWLHSANASNFAGTFEFASLEAFASARPFVYRINRGDPAVDFRQDQISMFAQDEIRIRPNFNVTFGARHEWHGNFADGHGIAPRASVAWAPGTHQKTVLRAGAGMFFEDYPKLLRQRTLLYDGSRVRELVVANPAYPDAQAAAGATVLPSITAAAPNLRLPWVLQSSIAVEREFNKRLHMTVEYQHMRGIHLLRSRNDNAPLPETGLRPDGAVLNRNLVESDASLRSDALNVNVRWDTKKRFSGMAQYSLSKTMDNAIGLFTMPSNSHDLAPEWGRADYDRRHRFSMLGTAKLPGKIRFGTVVTLSSGAPYDITTGFDDNGDTSATDRPAGVTRNTGQGPGLAQVDVRVSKMFDVRRLYKSVKKDSNNLEFSVDAFNVLNRTNLTTYIGQLSSPLFGRANAALSPRTLQLSARYHF